MRDYQAKINKGGVADSLTSTNLGAGESTSLTTEAKNAVSRSGQTLAPVDGTAEVFDQLAKALFINGVAAQTMVDGGAADAYILTPITGASGLAFPETYAQLSGAIFEFEVGTVNTGASTVDLGQTAGTLLGVKDIVLPDGVALSGDEMAGRVRILYDLGNDRFELLPSSIRIAVVEITASGTYDKPPGLVAAFVRGAGGGAGSGGTGATGVGEAAISNGGSGAGYAEKLILADDLSASETVTIGAFGAGAVAGNNVGSVGGQTSFGAHFTCNGGLGGLGGPTTSGNTISEGMVGGTATGGDINIGGEPSGDKSALSGNRASISKGGSTPLGTGGKPNVNGVGDDGTGYGSGGGGSSSGASSAALAGADGAPGVIIITEFY